MVNELYNLLITCAIALPILYILYLLVDFLYNKIATKNKIFEPLLFAFLSLIPTASLTVFSADLYSKKKISLGSLLTSFLASSDVLILAIIAVPTFHKLLLYLIIIKFIVAVIFGYIVNNFIYKKALHTIAKSIKIDNQEILDITQNNKNKFQNKYLNALYDTLLMTFFIFSTGVIFETTSLFIHDIDIANIIPKFFIYEILIVALLALIPSRYIMSIIITLFMSGIITFPALTAGMLAFSGAGVVVLFNKNKNIVNNINILFLTYLIAIVGGLITYLLI